LTAHGFCLRWEPGLIWLHVVADGGIDVAYFAIPLTPAVFVHRRRDRTARPRRPTAGTIRRRHGKMSIDWLRLSVRHQI
jgi:hypothetical protein